MEIPDLGAKLVPLDDAHVPPDAAYIEQPWSINSYTVNHPRKGGNLGLVGTADDYWRFAQMLLNRGRFQGQRILSPHVVDYMTTNHEKEKKTSQGWGLGFMVVADPAAVIMSSPGSYYWGGAANTLFWVDPKEDMVVVALCQDMRNPKNTLWSEMRTFIYSGLLD